MVELRDPLAEPAARQTRLQTVDGIALALEEFGNVPGADIVYAHGFGQTRQAWLSCARATARAGWTSTTYDARGHGQSSWLESGDYSVDQLVDDLRQVCASRSQAPVVVGASMGGLVGIALAGQALDACRGLILVDITPRWEAAGVERILAFMRAHPEGFSSLDEAAEVIAGYLPRRAQRKSPERLGSLLIPDADGRLRWHWDPRMLESIAHDGVSHQADLMQAATRIRVPTMLISGSESDVVSESTIAEFLHLVPHARHAVVEQATHMVAGDENTRFAGLVQRFLDELPSD